MNDIFTIGSFCFRLNAPDGVEIPEHFLKFRGGNAPEYTYTIELTDTLPEPVGAVVARRPDLLVLNTQTGERRYLGIPGQAEPYACYEETALDSARILIRWDVFRAINCDTVFCSLLALERQVLRQGAVPFHCAYVEFGGQAILFSAPSETGKTTQANLWEKYRGARTVNGDKCLLARIDGVWYARGWPVCGSSGICCNEDTPIRAVVVLSQAPCDRAESLAPGQAFTKIYSQITANRWNRAASLKAMDLAEQLVKDVSVIHLACTMNETAVEALEKALP